MLVLAPTRELALQIENELRLMSKYLGSARSPIYGGTAYGPQLEAFARGRRSCVGTPGRAARPPRLGPPQARQAARAGARRGRRAALARLLARHARDPEATCRKKRRQPACSRRRCPQTGASRCARLPERSRVRLAHRGPACARPGDRALLLPGRRRSEKRSALLRILDYEEPDSALIFCNTTRRRPLRHRASCSATRLDADTISGRSDAGRARARDEADQGRRAALPGRHRRRGARHRHQRPLARDRRTPRRSRPRSTCTAPAAPAARASPARRSRWCRASTSATSATLQKVNRIVIPGAQAADRGRGGAARRRAPRGRDRAPPARGASSDDRAAREETHLPMVESLCATPQGKRLLAAVLYEYLSTATSRPPRARRRLPSGPRPGPTSVRWTTKPRATRRAAMMPPRRRDSGGDRGGSSGGSSGGRRRRRRRAAKRRVARATRSCSRVGFAACALFRPPDRTPEIAPALVDLRAAGFEFAPDVRLRNDPRAVCDGLSLRRRGRPRTSAAPSWSRTARSRAPSKLRGVAVSRSGSATRLRATATCATWRAPRLVVVEDGLRAGVERPGVLADALLRMYKQLRGRLPARQAHRPCRIPRACPSASPDSCKLVDPMKTRRLRQDWPGGFGDLSRHDDLRQLWPTRSESHAILDRADDGRGRLPRRRRGLPGAARSEVVGAQRGDRRQLARRSAARATRSSSRRRSPGPSGGWFRAAGARRPHRARPTTTWRAPSRAACGGSAPTTSTSTRPTGPIRTCPIDEAMEALDRAVAGGQGPLRRLQQRDRVRADQEPLGVRTRAGSRATRRSRTTSAC